MRLFLLIVVVGIVSSCVDRNGITVSGREVTDDGTLETETKEIERKFSSVAESMKSGSEACLNRTIENEKLVFADGETRKVRRQTRYSTVSGQNSQMFVMHLSAESETSGGEFGPKGEILTVRAWPNGKKTFVSLEGGDETFRSLDVGILRMANGDSLICPRMPAEL